MKKLFSLFLCCAIVLTLTACGEKKKNNTSEIDLEYYAKTGIMPEAEYNLGSDAEDVISKLSKQKEDFDKGQMQETNDDHSETAFIFEVTEGEKNVLIDNGVINYYYNKDNKQNGISYIVNYDTAFGIKIGTLISEVQNKLSDYDLKSEKMAENDVFFAPYIIDGSVLKLRIKNVEFMFVFQENELIATAMYDTDNWKN